MKSFAICFFALALVVISFLSLYAQDNPSEEVPVAVNATPSSADTAALVIPANAAIAPVIMNEEIPHVAVEPVVDSSENISGVAEHAPFNRMKQLAGRWEGSGKNVLALEKDKIVVIYKVTAGGNAVMERIFPDTEQEMITLYYEEKGKLTLMHFSMIGTRSTMTLKPPVESAAQPNNVYEFELIKNSGLDPTVDTHMHSLKMAFLDNDHMNQEWEMFEAGNPSGRYSFILTRVPKNP